jgi:alpha-glucosidase
LRIRCAHPALGDGTLAWDDEAPEGALGCLREPGLRCLVNLSAQAIPLPPHRELLLTSATLDGGRLPADAAVWLASD